MDDQWGVGEDVDNTGNYTGSDPNYDNFGINENVDNTGNYTFFDNSHVDATNGTLYNPTSGYGGSPSSTNESTSSPNENVPYTNPTDTVTGGSDGLSSILKGVVDGFKGLDNDTKKAMYSALAGAASAVLQQHSQDRQNQAARDLSAQNIQGNKDIQAANLAYQMSMRGVPGLIGGLMTNKDFGVTFNPPRKG